MPSFLLFIKTLILQQNIWEKNLERGSGRSGGLIRIFFHKIIRDYLPNPPNPRSIPSKNCRNEFPFSELKSNNISFQNYDRKIHIARNGRDLDASE